MIIAIVCIAAYGVFILHYANNKNKQRLQENPNAVKVYLPTLSFSGISAGTLNIQSVDGEEARFFTEGTKRGFYVLPGVHIVESSFTKTRPGVLYTTVSSTFWPSKQEIEVQLGKSYLYDFDPESKSYSFTEKKD